MGTGDLKFLISIPLPSYQAIACLFSSEVTGIIQNSSGIGILRIAVQQAFPPPTRGRPALLGVDDAYYDILRVVRTGMQCGAAFAQRPRSLTSRSSRPCTNGSKRDASALPTNVSSGCIGGVGGLATVASIPHLSIISMAWTASVGCKHFGELTEGHRTLYNHHLIRRCNRSGLAIYCG